MLVRLAKQDGRLVPERLVRASDFAGGLGETNNPEWKTVAYDETSGADRRAERLGRLPLGREGQVEPGGEGLGRPRHQAAAYPGRRQGRACRASRSRISAICEHDHFAGTDHPSVLDRKVPVKTVKLADGEALVATVFDLFVANYGVDRGFGGKHVARSYDDNVPYTPAWAEKITGVPRDQIITVAREFARNAEKTNGRSMVIIGAAMNHWFHCDMNYRGVINMLVMCGCVGQSGGGWSHYVGQEKLRPQSGWLPLAFGLDWNRPPRQQNSTSFFYAHTDQWRYETLDIKEILSPTAPAGPWDGAIIDYNVRAERMGWLPSAPQLETNPLTHRRQGRRQGAGAQGLRRCGAEIRRAQAFLRGSGQAGQLAAQPVRLALQPARLVGQGPRIFPQAPARHLARRARQGSRRDRAPEAAGGRLARRGAGRKARPAGDARLPHVDHLRLFRHRAADRHLVREERSQHVRHASLHPPAHGGGGPGVGMQERLGDLQGDRQGVLRRLRRKCSASRRTSC